MNRTINLWYICNMEDNLRQDHNMYLQLCSTLKFRENRWKDIDWNERLVFIKGPRGVGKTSMILQYIYKHFGFDTKALYVTMDSLLLSNKTITEIAKIHINSGGTHLYIDEIHKYSNWSKELKYIYDLYKKLHVVISGSSILHLYKGSADLSRRAVEYSMHGMSFREYLTFETKLKLDSFTLDQILRDHVSIVSSITKKINPLKFFKNYLEHGYYPFYLEGTNNFKFKLNNTINQCIENDIPQVMDIQIVNINKIKKLLYHLAINVPFQPNSTKLAGSLELNRQTLNSYLQYLNEAAIIKLLWQAGKSYSLISKPEKLYLHNPNLCYLADREQVNIGNLRETFFLNQISKNHAVTTSVHGDFLVQNKFIFEIGGENKNFNQIAKLPNSYLVLDNELIGAKNKIPLWLFGFLY